MKELIEYLPFITEEAYLLGEKNGIPRETVYNRWARLMWDIERAITDPVQEAKTSLYKEWKEVCKKNGVSCPLFHARVKKMSPEEAATKPVSRRKKSEIK